MYSFKSKTVDIKFNVHDVFLESLSSGTLKNRLQYKHKSKIVGFGNKLIYIIMALTNLSP